MSHRRTIPPSAWAYLLACGAILAHQFVGVPGAGWLAGLAMLLFLILEFPRQRRYAQILFLVLTGAGLLAVAASDRRLALFLDGWQRGAVYGAFFLALTTLRDAAETSPLVRYCGRHLVAQPPGRRYAALAGGGHLFGIMLSYGSIELLGAMVGRANARGIERANARGSEQANAHGTERANARGTEPADAPGAAPANGRGADQAERGKRMLLAIQRGFCVMNCWNPLNLMTVVVATAVPTASLHLLLPLAFATSIGIMAIGWLEDRLMHPTPPPEPAPGGWGIHLALVLLVLAVMAASEGTSLLLGVSLVAAVTLAVPLAALLWIAAQTPHFVRPVTPGRIAGGLGHRIGRFVPRVPAFRGEATVLAASGFMGVTVGAVLPPDLLAPVIGLLPPILVPLLVPVLLIATGQVGLNPIAIVALIGAALPDPAALGIPPSALALSCMLGWGLAVGMTPMSASAIITARWAGVSPWTVGSRWNAAYTAGGLVLAWGAILLV